MVQASDFVEVEVYDDLNALTALCNFCMVLRKTGEYRGEGFRGVKREDSVILQNLRKYSW